MALPPGSQVWVKCDDGEWWPARTKAVTPDLRDFMDETEDGCVEFYHDVGQLYPVCTTDPAMVRPLHRDAANQDAVERSWFANPTTRDAVAKALQDHQDNTPLQQSRAGDTQGPARGAAGEVAPFTASELRSIRQLLGAVSNATATQMLQGLSHAGVDCSPGSVQRQHAKDRTNRKRQRAGQPAKAENSPRAVLHSKGVLPMPSGPRVPPHAGHARTSAGPDSTKRPSARRRTRAKNDDDDEGQPWSSSEESSTVAKDDREADAAPTPSTDNFVEPVGAEILEVFRSEVFENSKLFLLSPIYRFIDILGAVVVENADVSTTMPSPHAVRHMPQHGFDAGRRVVLVALTEDYSHTSGWMQPFKLEDTVLAMRLAVNGSPVPVPSNWSLTPGKEANAIRTAPVADVTGLVMASDRDLFSLEVGFTSIPEDTDLWRGIVACVFVEEVSITTIAEQIVANYRKRVDAGADPSCRTPHRSASREGVAVSVTEGYVKVQCPLTTVPMETPVRGVACEHLQCMELVSLLAHCVRSNLWNCPLCGASVKPRDIWVNHRLKDWLREHGRALASIEYVMETAPGMPLKAQFRDVHATQAMSVDDASDTD